MIIGNLSEVLDNEKSIYEALNDNIITQRLRNSENGFKRSTFGKILKSLSNYGMNWDDDVIKNMQSVPADKALQPKDDFLLQQSLYGSATQNWKVKGEEERKFAEKTLAERRETLRHMAIQPELEDIIDIMCNECVVYDDDEAYVGQPYVDTALIQDLTEKSAEEIRNCTDTSFYKIYLLLNWKNNCWDDFKRFLIDGVMAYEIIYDDLEYPKNIIGIIDVDPVTLTKEIKDGVTYWTQFKGIQGRERTLLDSQIIYIKYEDSGVSERQSYLERLIRPFNLYRIVEQAQVIWTVTQSSFKTIFTIPVGGMNKAKGIQTLRQAMNSYREDITFNIDSGELMVNGRPNMPFNKEYWMAENENGKPEIEPIVDNGPQLNDSDQIKYFEQKLYKMSKIPSSRFDREAQATWFGTDPTAVMRDEINFGRFISRIRNQFVQVLLKPLRIQVSLSVPDIKNDKRILDAISFRWNTMNQFNEMMDIEVMTKRVEFIGTMKDTLVVTDDEGNETPFFSPKFLIMKYLKMSEADLELNEKLKLEEKLAKQTGGESEDDESGDEGGDEEQGGGDSDMLGDDVGGDNEEPDKEMMGDVQPESPETTEA